MGARDLISRGLRTIVRAVEGEPRPGPYMLSVTGGWLPAGASPNFWQLGYNPLPFGSRSAMVEACISAYSQTIAMLPGDHWRSNAKGGRDRITNSALSRILRRPNDYQSISDFMLNAVRVLYAEGNAYALALRNDRFEIDELHLMVSRLSRPLLAETGEVFYSLMGNQIIDRRLGPQQLIVPQRDVLHIRLHSDTNLRWPFPLYGETPLIAAMQDIITTEAITQQQINYYSNQARPSAVLGTELPLKKEQLEELRDRWDDQAKGLNQGKVPILTHGLKVQPWVGTSKEGELAEIMKLSESRIALAYRIPLQILGVGERSPFRSTELLLQSWLASGLGFALNHVEEAFGLLFDLDGVPDEYVEFDTKALLRSASKDRIDSLARGVLGGIYSPNEARAEEGLPRAENGDEPRLQAQVVPLSAAANIPALPTVPPAGTSPAPGLSAKDFPEASRQTRNMIWSAARRRRHVA
jgi:HK97 family phage portal protein